MATQGVPLWSTTAASNSTADPAVNWAEGQAPSTVNDSARAMMASVAKWRDDLYGLTTGGTSTAYTVTTNATYASAAAMSGAVFTILPHTTSGASPTLAVDGLTARAINVSTGVAVPTGGLVSGTPYMVKYVHASTEFIILGPLAIANDAELKAIAGLTSAADKFPYFTGVGAAALADITSSGRSLVGAATTAARMLAMGIGIAFSTPKGRLALASGAAVPTSDVTAATTVYFTPYQGSTIMLPDASGDWSLYEFSEVSQALSDTTKSPAATAADSIYDIFGWLDGSTFRATRGPAWTSATGRGTGAGTTELTLLDGVYVNANAISNGPGASRGVYLGTIATNSSNQLNIMLAPSAAAGGSANRIDVWNNFNRVDISSVCRDSTDSWAYTTATWRSKNNNTNNRITLVRGLNEDHIQAFNLAVVSNNPGTTEAHVGIALDATNAIAAGSLPGTMSVGASGRNFSLGSMFVGLPGLGRHFIQAIEHSEASGGTLTWYGDAGDATVYQSGLTVICKM